MDVQRLTSFRRQKDEFFGASHRSPIPPGDRAHWEGLSYYEPNGDLSFTLEVQPGDNSEVTLQTSDGQTRTYRRLGTVTFEVAGAQAQLTLFHAGDDHQIFVPFRDATSGNETYGAGRYLDLEPNGDGTVTLDFNYAYNPYCAYNEAYSCPLPPHENWLRLPIPAGERHYNP